MIFLLNPGINPTSSQSVPFQCALHLVCWHFVEDFYMCVHQECWSVVDFPCGVFVWLLCQGYADLLENKLESVSSSSVVWETWTRTGTSFSFSIWRKVARIAQRVSVHLSPPVCGDGTRHVCHVTVQSSSDLIFLGPSDHLRLLWAVTVPQMSLAVLRTAGQVLYVECPSLGLSDILMIRLGLWVWRTDTQKWNALLITSYQRVRDVNITYPWW